MMTPRHTIVLLALCAVAMVTTPATQADPFNGRYIPTMTVYDSFGNLISSGSAAPSTPQGCSDGIDRQIHALVNMGGERIGENAVFLNRDQAIRLFTCFERAARADNSYIDHLIDPITHEQIVAWERFSAIAGNEDATHWMKHTFQQRDEREKVTFGPAESEADCLARVERHLDGARVSAYPGDKVEGNVITLPAFGITETYECVPIGELNRGKAGK